jgi:toxin ParE1/3/4
MRREVAYYQREAGGPVAAKLAKRLREAADRISREPGLGSPRLGQALNVEGLRAWPLDDFPMSLWYFERPDHVDVIRVVAHRQDRERIALE